MSDELCKDCGMILSPHSQICTVCGFDNREERIEDSRPGIPPIYTPYVNQTVPENYPGY